MNRRRVFFAAEAKLSARVRSSFLLFFDQTVPLTTIWAAAQPLRRLIAAALAGIDDFDFSHRSISYLVAAEFPIIMHGFTFRPIPSEEPSIR